MPATTSQQRERHFVADVKEHREHNAACVLFAWPMNASRRMTFEDNLSASSTPARVFASTLSAAGGILSLCPPV